MEQLVPPGFDHAEYKAALLKILDLARDSHIFLTDRSPALQVDIAKSYLWVSSVIGAIAMFLVKDVALSRYAAIALAGSVTSACVSFSLSLLVLWGRGTGTHALIEPKSLADHVGILFATEEKPAVATYLWLIEFIHAGNQVNIATNTRRTRRLRTAAPLLFASFLLLCISILLRSANV